MGLDKKPTPPPKRVKEDEGREESVLSPKDGAGMETERTGDDASSHSECKTSQPQDVKTQVKKETAEEDKVRDGIMTETSEYKKNHDYAKKYIKRELFQILSIQCISKNFLSPSDYEEDFEADDEGPADDDRAKEKKSSSPSPGTERQVKEERDASETEDDEKYGGGISCLNTSFKYCMRRK